MTDQPEATPAKHQLCPNCGSRLDEDASRCQVCGEEIEQERRRSVRARGRPEVTLSLPLAIALLVIFALLSAGVTYAAVRFSAGGEAPAEATETPTLAATATQTPSPQPTATNTPVPTPTPLTHIVRENETCLGLAAFYDVSVQSIVQLNNLPTTCPLSVGQSLQIPHPTPTPTAEPSSTLPPDEATRLACETVTYEVEANDTLVGIAANYNVSMQAILDYNSKTTETVFTGELLLIPLCERNPAPGPSATPTAPPPYPAPNLLLPKDGAPFTLANDTVTLQWAAVGQLREGEFYQVTVLDVTEGSGRRQIVAYVTDTKYIVPATFRPATGLPHVMRWWVTPVRQVGTNALGEPQYVAAGAESDRRDFTWSGAAGATPTP